MLSGTPVVQYCPDDPDTTESESPAIVAAISAEAEDADQSDGDGPQGLPVDHAAIKKHQQDDPILKEIREWHNRGQKWSLSFKLPRSFLEREGPLYKLSDDDGLLYRTTLVNTEGEVLPRIAIGHGGHATNDYINTIIDAAHDKYFHLGYPKLAEIIGAVYYTRHLHTAVKRRSSTCDACQRVHAHIKHKRRLGRVRFKGTAPGQVLAVDHMSMTDGKSDSHPNRIFRAIISITCGVTGFTWLRATFSLTIAELIHHLEVLFGDFGAPRILVFDGYAVNTPWLSTNQSQRLKKWASELGIIIVTLPPHGGPYAGWYERKHQFVRHALQVSSLTGAPLDSWPAQLPHIQLALNATPYGKGSDLSPLHILYSNCGRLPTDPIGDNDEAVKAGVSHLINPAEQSFLQQLHRDNASSFKLKFADYCEHWSKIKEVQQVAYQRRYGARPSKDVVTGDMVLVYSPSGHRMIPNFVGPYKVREILSNSTCRLEISDKGKKSISEVQLLANVVPYRIRDEDEDVMSWIQCCKCKVWHEVSELLFHRFRHEKARFVCAYINKRCGGPQDHTAV
ncbi:hypothetical protein FOZ60_006669 [Perkinsus olseni]|uniref:Integrase catalytic domain-containing protein n=1 Tax=Perkinsus olseni TaxID=32597 RepID=A0A7J6NQI1_PEROL|nr:hypothetical protein FOZ60_006669 [Perkinsus olseni]